MKILLILSFFISSLFAFSASVEKIESKYLESTLLFTIKNLKTNEKNIGSGFFINNDGQFLTNYHVLEDLIKKPNEFVINVQDVDGNELTNLEILKCENDKKIDLCLGKINLKEKVKGILINNKRPNKTQLIGFIGHSGTETFELKKAEVLDINDDIEKSLGVIGRDHYKGILMIELGKFEKENLNFHGDSGSAIFDRFSGDFVGVFCNSLTVDGKKHIYGIANEEIFKYLSDSKSFPSIKFLEKNFFSIKNSNQKGNEFDEELKTGKLQ